MSTERKLFANAFRQASPQRRVLCNQKTMSMKIEKNEERTVFGKEDQSMFLISLNNKQILLTII